MKRIVLLAAAAMLSASPVLAQSANPAQLSTPGIKPGVGAGRTGQNRREPAPPALPGARAEPTQVAPPTKSAAEMPPTEGLFDAINRGDLASAKDAVSRGADINGTNVLGLTPLDLAIDLGRNEISFMLLSLRGGAGYSTARGPTGADPAKPPNRAERMAMDRAERAERTGRGRTSRAVEGPPPAPQTARLFVGNGGAPVPQAGFLGFDAGR